MWEYFAIIAIVMIGVRADTGEVIQTAVHISRHTIPTANEETCERMRESMDPVFKHEVGGAMVSVWHAGAGSPGDLKLVYTSECRPKASSGA